MLAQLISINEYRKNISSLWKKAREKNIKYIVLSHSKPIFEVKPLYSNEIEDDDWDEYTKEYDEAWLQARDELERR